MKKKSGSFSLSELRKPIGIKCYGSLFSEPACWYSAAKIVNLNDYQVDETCRRTVIYAFKVVPSNSILK